VHTSARPEHAAQEPVCLLQSDCGVRKTTYEPQQTDSGTDPRGGKERTGRELKFFPALGNSSRPVCAKSGIPARRGPALDWFLERCWQS
jgi:hypothetical protein